MQGFSMDSPMTYPPAKRWQGYELASSSLIKQKCLVGQDNVLLNRGFIHKIETLLNILPLPLSVTISCNML